MKTDPLIKWLRKEAANSLRTMRKLHYNKELREWYEGRYTAFKNAEWMAEIYRGK